MSSFSAIAGVTKTLAKILTDSTGLGVDTLKSPDEDLPKSPAVNLFLLRVEQNPFFFNAPLLRLDPNTVQEPGIGLKLHYLVTPCGVDQIEIQKCLGEVVRTFHETPVIPPSEFDPSIDNAVEDLRVLLHPITLDEMVNLWRAFEKRSYRLSLVYEVSAIIIDSRNTSGVTPVAERVVTVGELR
jgi:hypothetical protein